MLVDPCSGYIFSGTKMSPSSLYLCGSACAVCFFTLSRKRIIQCNANHVQTRQDAVL